MLAELKNQNSKPFIIKEPKTIKKRKSMTIKQKTLFLDNNVSQGLKLVLWCHFHPNKTIAKI